MKRKMNLNNLPDDILLHITKQLGSQKDLKSIIKLSQTNKRFQKLLNIPSQLLSKVSENDEPRSILYLFRWNCRNGHLETAQWLVDKFGLTPQDARTMNNWAWRVSCGNGQLETAQWLMVRFGLTTEDARSDNNYAFRISCRDGHLETAQWLVDKFKLTVEDIRAKNNYALRESFFQIGNQEVVEYLVKVGEYTQQELNDLGINFTIAN